jgi:hypothetical protein
LTLCSAYLERAETAVSAVLGRPSNETCGAAFSLASIRRSIAAKRSSVRSAAALMSAISPFFAAFAAVKSAISRSFSWSSL